MNQLRDRLADTVTTVRGLVAEAAGADGLSVASHATLADTLMLAAELSRLAEALLVEGTTEVDRRSQYDEVEARLATRLGCRNDTEVMQRLTRASASTIARWRKASKVLREGMSLHCERLPAELPAVRDALVSGEVGIDGVLAIARPLWEMRGRVGREEILLADQVLADYACGRGPDGAPAAHADDLTMHAQAWSMALDSDGAEPTEARAILLRGLTLGRSRDGVVPLRGNLLPEVAAQLQRIIDACCSPYTQRGDGSGDVQFRPSRPASDHAEVGAEGTDNGELMDDRSRAQKQHDALATALFAAAASHTLPTIGAAAPTLVVSVRAEDLATDTGWAHLEGVDSPVSTRLARHVACAGVIQRVMLGKTGRILRLGTEERVFNRHQRRAIALRDGGCIIPGCGIPAAWCEIHHVTEHSQGGPTHTDNGVLLCWHHHRFIDSGPWRVRMNQGIPEVQAPTWFDKSARWRPVTKSRTRMHSLLVQRT